MFSTVKRTVLEMSPALHDHHHQQQLHPHQWSHPLSGNPNISTNHAGNCIVVNTSPAAVRQPPAINNDVHITQPCSLPTSPSSSPRPLSAVSSNTISNSNNSNHPSPTPSPLLGPQGILSVSQCQTSSSSSSPPAQQQQQQQQQQQSHSNERSIERNSNSQSQNQNQNQSQSQLSTIYVVQPSNANNSNVGTVSSGYGSGIISNVSSTSSSSLGSSVESADCTKELDWQSTKICVRERNAAMCNNELMADVFFVVSNNGGESKKYPAHKFVLATGSTVFYAMFFGSLAETKAEITVVDVEPDAFLKMLKYLYADEIRLDEDSVLATLNVAKKYMIPYLARACVQFMEASLTACNACVLLSQSRIFDEPDLMQRCWEVIDAQAEMALNSEGFMDIDHATLQSILSRETLNCKELDIFNAAMAWANAECERREIEPTPENLRAALGTTLNLIRVPTMQLYEFADGPAQTGIFSLQESHDLFLHFTASVKPKIEYCAKPRTGLKPQVCHRFQSSAYRSNQWRYRGRCDSIQFCVDRRIFIVGFGLYGSSGGASTYTVHMELKKSGRVLAENNTEFFSDGSSNTFHVYFQQPVQVDPDTYYTASAVLDGLELSFFGQEGMTDVTVGNVGFQFQCSTESTNGTGVQGGQIPELIFYGPTTTTASSIT